eukprot:Rhum_TRINITY_DN23379_c0_g1::Rhum_TRINITY_DN23379_c0_g1_i1::g.177707::m.177707
MAGGTEYLQLCRFLDAHGLGSYADMLFDRGVTTANFHKLSEVELAAMRLTNTALLRKILQLCARQENIRHRNSCKSAAASRARKSSHHSTTPAAAAAAATTSSSYPTAA